MAFFHPVFKKKRTAFLSIIFKNGHLRVNNWIDFKLITILSCIKAPKQQMIT